MQNYHDYGLAVSAIVITVVFFGFAVPIFSIFGPTKEAMNKNLRASLDASQRNGSNEVISVTVSKLQDMGISGHQTAISIFLIVFGFMAYYLIPLSLLFQNLGLLFFVMNRDL